MNRITASMARKVADIFSRATPKSKSVPRKGRTRWTVIQVEFDAGLEMAAAALLAGRCRARGYRRYLDMGSLPKSEGGAFAVTATSPSASVRLVEQYNLMRDQNVYRMDVMVA